jgi:formate/nitrite transporter FocA (FNT family)
MLQEMAKPVALMLCMLVLCGVFYTAFLAPAASQEQTVWDSLILLSLAAGVCVSGGMLFREREQESIGSLLRTLPVQLFCWAVGLMLILFFSAQYLETHCIFYRDIHRF